MSDPYPSTLSIEIDRDRLRNYLRAKWLLAWTLPLTTLGAYTFGDVEKTLADSADASRSDVLLLALRSIGTGIAIALIIALILYFVTSHRLAARLAASLDVSVEGPFLHVRQHGISFSDRKLHFRSIVDYTTTQDLLMRWFGVFSLQMATTAGGPNTHLLIHGVKDCLRVRDLLAEIDRVRENQ
jgi:hypothetical protein